MKQLRFKFHHRFFLVLILSIILLIAIYVFYIQKVTYAINFEIPSLNKKIYINTALAYNKKKKSTSQFCNFFTCFNVYQCGNKGNQLSVHIYTPNDTNTEKLISRKTHLTQEFHSILQVIISSKYYVSNPNEACILVPNVDMLNLNRRNLSMIETLHQYQFTRNGTNHLLFQYILEPVKYSENIHLNKLDQAMVAGIGFTKLTYRKNFDISLPVFSSSLSNLDTVSTKPRKWFSISSQINVNPDIQKNLLILQSLHPNHFNVFDKCSSSTSLRCRNNSIYQYPGLLQYSTFCFVLKGEKLGLSILLESLAYGCIPVIVYDSLVMPFNEVIDWYRAAIFVQEINFMQSINLLKNYSFKRITELQKHGHWLYRKYFKTMKDIVETMLDIIADRIFPHSAKSYYLWNEPQYSEIDSPILLPLTISKNDGFTAVVLTYDRVDLLLLLILKLSRVPSLRKILIVWNNEYKKPLQLSKIPNIHKEIKIVRTEKNVLSNRFYPFDEIETEAILSIDDDIIMLTEDEIEFAYEVWREFPDRIVGFPSRTHAWDNKTNYWKYESEWTNHISMILTGAAFYHKYWNYVYTTKLPKDMKKWIDFHMNCEDIAMNFLITNVTKKSPIKVTAKKKFRCPECINTEMLSTDLTHMVERTQCINKFTNIFGKMPLTLVEFRADPVLFKDNFPNKLKRFNDVGSL